VKIYNTLVIVTPIWQKLNNIEHKKTLIVTNIWRNHVWDDNIFDFQIPLSQGLWISEVRNVIAPIRSDLANCLMVSK
jgi:hypothetical protein